MAKLLIKNGEAILVDGEVLLATEATPELQTKSVSYTPTESQQTATVAPDTGYDGLDEVNVTVGAIASDYVASGITRRSSSDLTASGGTVTAPAGYYQASASKSVAAMTLPKDPSTTSSGTSKATIDRSTSTRYLNIPTGYNSTAQYYTISAVPNGSAATPATTITANPSISVNASGLITATASASQSVTPTVNEGYVSSGTAGTITVSGSNTSQLSTQAGTTITPTESQQTAVAAGKYTTGAVNVAAISSTYVGSGIERRDETDLTASGATVTVPAGYYEEQETKSVASGSAGTPTATKGTVSNHSVSVTPSVTNTTGYITGGTKTGTAVTVSASELVSGSQTITANSTVDVTNLAQVVVSVDAPTPSLQEKSVSYTPSETAISANVTPDSGYDGLSKVAVSVGAISSDYVGSNITRRSSTDLTVSGATVAAPAGYYASNASKSVASGSVTAPTTISGTAATVSTGTNTLTLTETVSVTPNVTTAGYISSGTAGNSSVSLTANVNTRSSSDLTVNGATVTAPAGYYSSSASKSVASGTEGTPTATKGTVTNHSVTVTPSVTNSAGYISGGTKTGTGVSVSASELVSGSKSITSNGTGIDVANYATVDVNVAGGGSGAIAIIDTPDSHGGTVREIIAVDISNDTVTAPHLEQGYTAHDAEGNPIIGTLQPGGTINLQAKTNIAPTTSSQTITADAGYDGLSSVQINAMPTGTAGTPTATKGTVSNHSVTVTPSVTNTTGYITGSTKTGTAVTVSASELVSGSETKTANGTYDVTNLAQLVVSVSGSGKAAQIASGVGRVASQTYVSSDISLTVGKTGKYSVYWNGYRSSTSGTSGSQLYIGTTAYGSANTTFNGTYTNVQNVHLSGVSLTADQTITVYARSRSGSYYMYIMNLVIIEE